MKADTTFLRRILAFDAATCAAMGLGLALGAGPLARVFELPDGLLREAGILLLPFAALLVWTAQRDRVLPGLVWAIIGGNAAWTMASAALLLGGILTPNALGLAFVAGQAVAVAIIAEVEALALRRARAAALA
ncbi:MAG TPA: hypothetical protein VM899_02290 [Rubellimicrobium sp.]|nr:hypothetical protein [Rubellimicrobium sp.]